MKITGISGVLLFLLTSLPQGTAGESITIRLTVAEPNGVARRGWLVTSGVPLGRGIMRDGEQTALFAGDGLQVPLQTEVLSRWPDGSVRWLLLDFSIDLAAGETKRLTLQCGSAVRRAPVANGVRAVSRDDAVVIETGPMRVALSPKSFRLLDDVRLDRDGDGGSATFHASEAFAYEAQLTGNQEHGRIMRDALRTAIAAGMKTLEAGESVGQTGYYSGIFLFPPFAFSALEDQ